MKKNNLFKKATSFILSISMLLSLTLPSYAGRPGISEPGTGGEIAPQQGSIEISKTATDGKTPIDGVEFSYVKVADMIQESGEVHSIKFRLNEEGRIIFPAIADQSQDYVVSGSVLNKYVKDGGVGEVAYPASQKGETANGKVTFSNLPIGVYLVEETNTKNATINGEKVQVSKGVGPFLVSIPQTSPDGTSWLYDIKVDAKNVIDDETITKTVEGDDVVVTQDGAGFEVITAGIGTTMWYTVTGSASKVIEESIYTQYEIEDTISSSLMYGEKNDSEGDFLNKIEVYLDGTEAINKLNAADYKITTKKTTMTGRFAGFNVSLTKSGLEKLNNLALVDVTTVSIKYPVHMTEEVLDIEAVNAAKIMYTHKGGNPGTEETELEVFPLGLEVEKLFDNINVEKLPAGTEIDPTKVKFIIERKGEPNTPIYVKKTDSYVHGTVFMADLTVTSEGNGFTKVFNISEKGTAIVIGLPKGTYVITEIATVDGYSLLKESIEVTIDKDQKITSKMVPTDKNLDIVALSSINVSNVVGLISENIVTHDESNIKPLASNMNWVEVVHNFDEETNILDLEYFLNGQGKDITNSTFELHTTDKYQTFKPETLKFEIGTAEIVDGWLVLLDPVDVTNQIMDDVTLFEDGLRLNFDLKATEQLRISFKSDIDFGPLGPPVYDYFHDKTKWVGGNVNYSGTRNIIFVFYEKIRGAAKIIKVDANNPSVTLPGAQFDLYISSNSKPIKRVTTNAAGEIYLNDLKYGFYYLREVVPPTGYIHNVERVRFEITLKNYTQLQVVKAANTRDGNVNPIDVERPFDDISKLTINNEKAPAFELPSTGGTGTFVYTIAGLLLVSAAALLYITLNKRNR